ncbi:MAG: metallophosphoesterase [Candidatus Delongbacteria bacterium]|nr:metallophosphoesterase [Candidatus Delongbacteria bacterium]
MRLICILMLVCVSPLLVAQTNKPKEYLFFAHAYDEYYIDSRLKQIGLRNYDGIFMGGDILSEASLDRKYLSYLDSLVDLSNPMTLWALGNHDSRNGNWDWIFDFTQRKTYFAHYQDESVFIVLNTNIVPYDCEELENQFSIISNVCDTIVKSKNLFLIMHHIIWDGVPGLDPGWTVGHVNLKYWLANCETADSHFKNTIYPLLVNVKNRNIDVFCTAGDMGSGTKKKYSQLSSDQIWFLGCGLYEYSSNDEVLMFKNNNGEISFKFHNLDSLVSVNSIINKL